MIGGAAIALMLAACSSAGAQNTTSSALRTDDPWADVETMMYDANYQGVEDEATKRMNRDGKSVAGLTLRGIAYAKLEKQFLAYDDLIEATQMDRNVDTLLNIGNALRMYGHCDRASDAYKQALALSPGNVEVLMNLTSAYLCMGDMELADQTIQQTLSNFPKDAVSYTNMAIIKHMANQPAEAREAAQKALNADEDYVPAWQVLYRACVALNDKACADDAQRQHNTRIGKGFKKARLENQRKANEAKRQAALERKKDK